MLYLLWSRKKTTIRTRNIKTKEKSKQNKILITKKSNKHMRNITKIGQLLSMTWTCSMEFLAF